jgi:hypothetical protein
VGEPELVGVGAGRCHGDFDASHAGGDERADLRLR